MGSVGANHYSVVVAGAGPVGLTTAINMARLGVKVLIIERGEEIDQSPRAGSYQPCAMAELEETGTLDDVKKESVINNILTFWTSDGPNKKRLAYVEKMEGGKIFPAGINCPQPVLAGIMLKHLLSKYSSEVRFSQRLETLEQDDSQVRITCRNPLTEEITAYTCDWLVGSDGAGSTTRKLLGISFDGFTWPKEEFVASNVRYDFPKHGFTTANMVCHPVHWAVITILDKTGLWRCAFGCKPGMTNEQIRAELDEHYRHIFPGWPGDGYELVELNRYKPHQRCASKFRKGRCILAGDAAHSNNPIGGLGLTTGLLDAGPLGRALGAVVNGKAPETILDICAEARRTKWLTFTNGFSIENKRIIQLGGYSEDIYGIWKIDEVAKQHGMGKWIDTAILEKKEADEAFFKSLEDKEAQLQSRMKQWEITMDPRWMEEYEDPEVVRYRISLRPEI
ncbi:hypothetical protein B7463_g6491, partial [Scytalidium lignicola]